MTGTLPFSVNSSVSKEDRPRLTGQLGRVYDSLISADDHLWLTLEGIAYLSKANYGVVDSEASVSARLRDLRKAGYHIEKRKRSAGLWEYRLNLEFLEKSNEA